MLSTQLGQRLLRPARAALTSRFATTVPMRRASQHPTQKEPSETAKFYKQFTRPVAKVLLMAVLTYQVVYWGWVKLETDSIIAETEATKAELEAKVAAYKQKLSTSEKSS